MAEISFVKVVDTGPGWNKVLASDGNTYTLRGDYNWRSNNPGNIEYGPYAKSMGAIGSGAVPKGRKRGFAIFPSYEAGSAAQSKLIFESPNYKDLTVAQAIARYAPSFENDTASYAKQVAAAAGVSVDAKMSDLTPQQRRAFLAKQEQVEGFKPGTIKGADGVPVSQEVIRQFSGTPLPPGEIPTRGASASAYASSPDRVGQLQSQLKRMGFDPGQVDGVMGPRTKAAVREFQKANGLAVDGIVGPQTSAVLAASAGGVPGSQNPRNVSGIPNPPPLPRPRPDMPSSASIPLPPNPAAVPANRQPVTAQTASGRTVEIGNSYITGNKLKMAQMGADGKAVLVDVEDMRDDALRKVNPLAPMVFDKGAAGGAARAVAAPMVRQGIADASRGLASGIGTATSGAASTLGGLMSGAGAALGGMFSAPKPSATAAAVSTFKDPLTLRLPVTNTDEYTNKSPQMSYSIPGRPVQTTSVPAIDRSKPQRVDYWQQYGAQDPTGGVPSLPQKAPVSGLRLPVAPAPPVPPAPLTPPAPPAAPWYTPPSLAPVPPAPVAPIPLPRPVAAPIPMPRREMTPAPQPRAIAPAPVPKPQTFAGSATGNTYAAGQLYRNVNGVYRANPDGTFTKVNAGQPPAVMTALSTTPQASPGYKLGGGLLSLGGMLGGLFSQGTPAPARAPWYAPPSPANLPAAPRVSPSQAYEAANSQARAKASQSIGGSSSSGSSSGNLGGVSSSGRRYDYDNNKWV